MSNLKKFGIPAALFAVLAGGAAIGTDVFDSAASSPAPASTLTGKFLHLSDIHFDVETTKDGKDLADVPVDQWKSHFDASATPSSRRYQDTNFALLMSTLNAAKAAGDYDFILYTGDYLKHDFPAQATADKQAEYATKTVEFVNLMISETFPSTPIVAALGNNDSGCGDYNIRPKSAFLADLAPNMPIVDGDAAAEAEFAKAGYFSIEHPTVKDTDFVVLGTYWSTKSPGYDHGHTAKPCDKLIDPDLPGKDQTSWLSEEIGSASSGAAPVSRNAILVMHIPPGIDGYGGDYQWQTDFSQGFEDAVTGATHQVIGAFAGHTHMNEMRVLKDDSSNPYLAVRVAPSVSTFNGNQPSFTVADYDLSTGKMTDYEVHTLRAASGQELAWRSEYRFTNAYGVGEFSPATISSLANEMQKPGDPRGVRQKYLQFYRGTNAPSAMCSWHKVVCATSNDDETAFKMCTDAQDPYPRSCG